MPANRRDPPLDGEKKFIGPSGLVQLPRDKRKWPMKYQALLLCSVGHCKDIFMLLLCQSHPTQRRKSKNRFYLQDGSVTVSCDDAANTGAQDWQVRADGGV